MRTRRCVIFMALVLGALVGRGFADPMGTAFMYQGKLLVNGLPANGDYSILFTLYTAQSDGSQVNGQITQTVSAVDGLFSVELDFGDAAFDGQARWLEMAVKPAGSPEARTTLTPRQQLTPAPYALYAGNADRLDGLDAGAFLASGTDKWVDTTGDSMTGPLTVTSSGGGYTVNAKNTGTGHGFNGESAYQSGVGVKGAATSTSQQFTSYGGYFTGAAKYSEGAFGQSTGAAGRGVHGKATGAGGAGATEYAVGVYGEVTNSSGGKTSGGRFTASGSSGVGVRGEASGVFGTAVRGEATDASPDTNYGGYFQAAGGWGEGVHGAASGAAATYRNYGGNFDAAGGQGAGVKGSASYSGAASNVGGEFSAAGTTGQGVSGQATNGGDYLNYGGYFRAAGGQGRAVYGEATKTGDYQNYGGYFVAAGDKGVGVYAENSYSGSSDTVYPCAVQAISRSPSGMGVDALATGYSATGIVSVATNSSVGSSCIGGRFEAHGGQSTGVMGHCLNPSGTSYGGLFSSVGSTGRGVRGEAWGANGRAGEFFADGDASAYGVWASASKGLYDFYAGGKGNYGPFTGSHDVQLAADFPRDAKIGLIVSATGQTEIKRQDGEPSICSTLPTVKLADSAKDKAVLGVLLREAPLPEDHWRKAAPGERFATINALGEGRVWVSNVNGDIGVGDYITTSAIAGHGQRQDDDLLHSFTLGKATESVDWESVTGTIDAGGKTVKIHLIAVVYTSG
ncbi:MAG: hypothetical protein NTW86_10715 [Candidatus Sumerlaeota bacterium]|nr:hypothetical protein [Candidatus Sumerlaeota bacterium]